MVKDKTFNSEKIMLLEDLENSIDPRNEIIENDGSGKNILLTLSDNSYKTLASRANIDINNYESGTIDIYANVYNNKMTFELIVKDTDIDVIIPIDEYEIAAIRKNLSKVEKKEWLSDFARTFKQNPGNIDAYVSDKCEKAYIISKDIPHNTYIINEYNKDTKELIPISKYTKYSDTIRGIEELTPSVLPINLEPCESIYDCELNPEPCQLDHNYEYQEKTHNNIIWKEHSVRALIELGNELLKEKTHGTMSIVTEPTAHDDYLPEETVLSAITEAIEHKQLFSFVIEDYAYDCLEYSINMDTQNLYDEIIIDIDKHFKDFNTAIPEQTGDAAEILSMFGCTGWQIDLPAFLSHDYKLNIMLATPAELNFDMSSIADAYNNPDLFKHDDAEFIEASDNALTYLIHQQGYTVKNVIEAVMNEKETGNTFIDSVADEINNLTYSINELTILVNCGGQELLEIFDKIALNAADNLEISTNATIGLFNEWSGAGSILGINLEKPLIVPISMIKNIQIECRSKNKFSYTVDDVYGLTGQAWRGTVKLTDEIPELITEDLHKTFETGRIIAEAHYE